MLEMTDQEQFQALNVLDYLSDLFSCSGKTVFTKEDVLIILNLVKNDPEMFDPDTVVAQERATAHLVE